MNLFEWIKNKKSLERELDNLDRDLMLEKSKNNRLKKDNDFLQEQNEKYIESIKDLKTKLKNNTKIYLNTSKYASEMESKYVVENYIVTELEKWLEEEINIYDEARKMHEKYSVPEERCNAKYHTALKALNKLQELKGSDKE